MKLGPLIPSISSDWKNISANKWILHHPESPVSHFEVCNIEQGNIG